jgi:phospholipid/cholesterol/gamma-HCH transport system substrate-binding protein
MKKPFKFRYVNQLVGVFVLLVASMLIAAIVLTGRAQGWFEPTYELRAVFPEEGTMGLRRGSEVRVLETPAGMVQDIMPREDGAMEVVISIRGRFYVYVRQDSTALVKKALGVAGDAFVEITRGYGEPIAEDHPYIDIMKDTEILDIAESLLAEVRATTVPAIEELQALLEGLNQLIDGLNAGQGAVGTLLKDERMAREVEASVAEVNIILANVSEATAHLPRMMERLAGELEDVPGLVYQTQATLQEVEVLLEGLQRHWLIRKYIDKESDPGERISPSVLIGAGERR